MGTKQGKDVYKGRERFIPGLGWDMQNYPQTEMEWSFFDLSYKMNEIMSVHRVTHKSTSPLTTTAYYKDTLSSERPVQKGEK